MTKKNGREYWTEEEAGRVLDELEQLGISDTAYAREKGLTTQRLSWWRKRLGRSRRTAKSELSFVEVLPVRSNFTIEVRLVNGRAVTIPLGIELKALGPLLAIIEGQC